MTQNRRTLILAVVLAVLVSGAAAFRADAQTDSVGVAPASAGNPHRASWTSDRVVLRTGDLVTVVIDEQTSARERASETGTDRRSTRADFRADIAGEEAVGNTALTGGWTADSRHGGELNRQGDLFGVVTARVLTVEPSGLAEIEGSKSINIDGREQEITVRGHVRPHDLSSGNTVLSSRIAGASITYKGKDFKPKKSIFGKILSILWPL